MGGGVPGPSQDVRPAGMRFWVSLLLLVALETQPALTLQGLSFPNPHPDLGVAAVSWPD